MGLAVRSWVALCLAVLSGCSPPTPPNGGDVSRGDGANGSTTLGDAVVRGAGMSGLARHRDGLYLVVHDTKRGGSRPRISAVALHEGEPPHLRSLPADWSPAGGPPSDLEEICPVPGRTDEYLVVESGPREGRPGRLAHLRAAGESIDSLTVEVLRAIELPPDTRDVEGAAFVPRPGGPPVLLTCERDERKAQGATAATAGPRHALLRWNEIDLDRRRLEPVRHTRVLARVWPEGGKLRTCSALCLDGGSGEPTLWIAATVEPTAGEPYDSVIYRLPLADLPAGDAAMAWMETAWRVRGSKVEGLAPAPPPGSGLVIATDEDASGGGIRLLPPRPAARAD